MPLIALDFAADVEPATSETPPRIPAIGGGASAIIRGGNESSRSLEPGP